MIIRTLAAAAATAALGFAAAPAFAQAPAGAQAQNQTQAQNQAQIQVEPIANEDLTDAQVVAFIDAAMGIQAVIAAYQPQMQAAESPEDAAALQQQAQDELVEAVEDAGLTPEVYQSIGAAAQADPEVAERLRAEAETRQGAGE
ncbi:MAG: DUF4168 domain-containing protein [Oceanicaulis sp.]